MTDSARAWAESVAAQPRRWLRAIDDPRATGFKHVLGHDARHSKRMVVEGRNNIIRLLSAQSMPGATQVLCTTAHLEGMARELGHPERSRIPALDTATLADQRMLAEVTGFRFHRGCLASHAIPASSSLVRWSSRVRALHTRPQYLVYLERLADPANLGAIVRNANCLGAQGLIVDPRTASPWSRKSIRASAGSVFSLPIHVCRDPRATLRFFRDVLGYHLTATGLGPRARPLTAIRWPTKTLIMLGNEGDGLAPESLELAELELTIPMARDFDSLNVATTSGIVMHELWRTICCSRR